MDQQKAIEFLENLVLKTHGEEALQALKNLGNISERIFSKLCRLVQLDLDEVNTYNELVKLLYGN